MKIFLTIFFIFSLWNLHLIPNDFWFLIKLSLLFGTRKMMNFKCLRQLREEKITSKFQYQLNFVLFCSGLNAIVGLLMNFCSQSISHVSLIDFYSFSTLDLFLELRMAEFYYSWYKRISWLLPFTCKWLILLWNDGKSLVICVKYNP